MSKQVRLRRGTTVQHATFTGADGEVTYDTDLHCLRVHDGATPGGHPLKIYWNDGGIKTITDQVQINADDGISYGLYVLNTLSANRIEVRSNLFPACIQWPVTSDLTYAATVDLNMVPAIGDAGYQTQFTSLALTGNVTFTTSNKGRGAFKIVRIVADASLRTLTFPAWVFVGGAAPANIAANKTGLLKLWCYSTTDASIVAEWSVQP